jgi:hypothetical protein
MSTPDPVKIGGFVFQPDPPLTRMKKELPFPAFFTVMFRLIGVLMIICAGVAMHRQESALGIVAAVILGVAWFRLPERMKR